MDSHFLGFQCITVKCEIYSIIHVQKKIFATSPRGRRDSQKCLVEVCANIYRKIAKEEFPEKILSSQLRKALLPDFLVLKLKYEFSLQLVLDFFHYNLRSRNFSAIYKVNLRIHNIAQTFLNLLLYY